LSVPRWQEGGCRSANLKGKALEKYGEPKREIVLQGKGRLERKKGGINQNQRGDGLEQEGLITMWWLLVRNVNTYLSEEQQSIMGKSNTGLHHSCGKKEKETMRKGAQTGIKGSVQIRKGNPIKFGGGERE